MRYMTIHHIALVYTFSTFTTVVWHLCLTDIAKNEKTRRKKTAYDKQRPFFVCVCSTLTFVKPKLFLPRVEGLFSLPYFGSQANDLNASSTGVSARWFV